MPLFNPVELPGGFIMKIADPEDSREAIVEALTLAIEESAYGPMYSSEEGLFKAVERYADGDLSDHIMVCIWDPTRAVVLGMIFGDVGTYHRLCQPVTIASETLWWLDPTVRKAKLSGHLLDAFETWAKMIKADFISMATQCNGLEDRVGKIYSNRGYAKMEEHYLMKVQQ